MYVKLDESNRRVTCTPFVILQKSKYVWSGGSTSFIRGAIDKMDATCKNGLECVKSAIGDRGAFRIDCCCNTDLCNGGTFPDFMLL